MSVSKLTRQEFLARLQDKRVDVDTLKNDARAAGVPLATVGGGNGAVDTDTEKAALWTLVDSLDTNGDRNSVALRDAQGRPTAAARLLEAITASSLPVTAPGGGSTGGNGGQLRDAALARAFAGASSVDVKQGSSGEAPRAVQYALARLGHYTSAVDGAFGPGTARAVRAFQASAGLPQDGVVNRATLQKLDEALAGFDGRTPASRAASPAAYLRDFQAHGIAPFQVVDTSRPVSWSHPEVKAAYGTFLRAYWEVCKQNRVEADCKNLALHLFDQFRDHVQQGTGVRLPQPTRLPALNPGFFTAQRTGGHFSRFESLPRVRPGYSNAIEVQKMDPAASMLFGVNVRYAGINADMVGRAMKVSIPWDPARDNAGDQRVPEVPVDRLQPGDVIALDHDGGGKWDHVVTVIDAQRDAAGRTTRLVIATGSFDDMKDADGSTAPNSLAEVNNYAEEVTIDLGADGKVTGSRVTWSSEPSWLVDPRYAARNTIMDMKPGARVLVGRLDA